MTKLFRSIFLSILVLGAVLLFLSLIPGDFSLLGSLKSLADRTVSDGDFEAVTIDFYNRVRLGMAVVGGGLLVTGGGAYFSRQRGHSRWERGFVFSALLMSGVALLAIGNLAASRLNSQVYRYLSGTPLAYEPPPPTPVPPPTQIPSPTPTLMVSEPGRWELLVGNLEQPVLITGVQDGSGRLFVATKLGVIWLLQDKEISSTPFLDIRDRVLQAVESPEQGFLGLVFHPDYAQNGYFYVNYIDALGDTIISRFQVSSSDPNLADPASETRLLRVMQPEVIHNGGHLAFGPDGYLYMSLGDGGIRTDPGEYAQALDTFLGKILRIDVDHGEPYSIPSNNPFVGRAGWDEIWAFGLRNPWQFSFDALTGDMYIADVGHDDFEEIDFIPAGSQGGLNFGWNHYEGKNLYTQSSNPPPSPLPDHVPPIWEYQNHQGGKCAVIGGNVYYGEIPSLQGTYIYGDYCSGIVWGLRQNSQNEWVNETLFDTDFLISSFGEDEDHNLYLVDLVGNVYELVEK